MECEGLAGVTTLFRERSFNAPVLWMLGGKLHVPVGVGNPSVGDGRVPIPGDGRPFSNVKFKSGGISRVGDVHLLMGGRESGREGTKNSRVIGNKNNDRHKHSFFCFTSVMCIFSLSYYKLLLQFNTKTRTRYRPKESMS